MILNDVKRYFIEIYICHIKSFWRTQWESNGFQLQGFIRVGRPPPGSGDWPTFCKESWICCNSIFLSIHSNLLVMIRAATQYGEIFMVWKLSIPRKVNLGRNMFNIPRSQITLKNFEEKNCFHFHFLKWIVVTSHNVRNHKETMYNVKALTELPKRVCFKTKSFNLALIFFNPHENI